MHVEVIEVRIIFMVLLLFNVLSVAEWHKSVVETFREFKNVAIKAQLQEIERHTTSDS